MILAAMAFSLAAVAQGSIDDDWARVSTCERLSAFRRRWGERNRYSRFYTEVAQRRACVRRPPQPQQHGTTTQARPARRAPLLQTVTLDVSGRGHVTTLSAALDRVADGGVILIQPGTYFGGIPLRRNVTLRGVVDSAGNQPTIRTTGERTPPLHIYSGNVILESLNLRAEGPHANALYITRGTLTANNVHFTWTGARIPNHEPGSHAAVYVGSDAVASIHRSHIGPGESQALAIDGRASVSITDSSITNAGGTFGIFLADGSLTLRRVNISNSGTALTAENNGRAALTSVLIHSVNYRNYYPIYATNNATIRIDRSVVCIPPGFRWGMSRENAHFETSGIFDANGAVLEAPNDSDLPQQARRLCAGRF